MYIFYMAQSQLDPSYRGLDVLWHGPSQEPPVSCTGKDGKRRPQKRYDAIRVWREEETQRNEEEQRLIKRNNRGVADMRLILKMLLSLE